MKLTAEQIERAGREAAIRQHLVELAKQALTIHDSKHYVLEVKGAWAIRITIEAV